MEGDDGEDIRWPEGPLEHRTLANDMGRKDDTDTSKVFCINRDVKSPEQILSDDGGKEARGDCKGGSVGGREACGGRGRRQLGSRAQPYRIFLESQCIEREHGLLGAEVSGGKGVGDDDGHGEGYL